MPFYEYQCKSCGHTLEAMQKINDAPLKKCPDCGKSQLTRLMSAPVFRLKGAGWYETDFKGDQDHKKNLADAPEAESSKDDKTPAADVKGDKAEGKTDAAAKDAAKPAETAKESPKDKPAPAESAKKPVVAGISKRGSAAPAPKPKPKPTAKKAVKKPVAKAKKRR